MIKRKKNLWGWDVYLIAFLIISVHLSIIIAKFFGKDIGPTIPESLDAISRQIEIAAVGYSLWRSQKQVNGSHQRVSKLKDDVEEKLKNAANDMPKILP